MSSRSKVKVKSDGVIGLSTCDIYMAYFLAVTCDLENEVKVKFDGVIGFSTCGFLFFANTFIWPILLRKAATDHYSWL